MRVFERLRAKTRTIDGRACASRPKKLQSERGRVAVDLGLGQL
jgi:hypothetical protein